MVPQYKTDKGTSECNKKAMKMMKGLEHLFYNVRRRALRLLSQEKDRMDLINVFKQQKGSCKENITRSILLIPRDLRRGNGHKGKQRRLCLNISRILFYFLLCR